ncbi:MAG: DUF3386 domain-containing protein [Thermostichales cyanobacterium HHBFW_bins_127]
MVAITRSAQELFQAAYENRYTWDPDFPGYRATVIYRQGDQEFSGQVQVGSDLKATVSGVEDEAARKAIHSQLWETAIHRVRRSFAETHGQNTFSYGETFPDGTVEILVGGKAAGDRYHVRDNQVTMVHRHIHGVVVTIHTYSSHDTGAGYLSHRYDSVYHDPQTGEQKGEKSLFTDTYTQVGGYWILAERQIESGSQVQSFRFQDIELLG